jgi:hypothetical protein
MNMCSHWRREQYSHQRKKYSLPTNSAAIHQGGNPNISTDMIKSNKAGEVLSLVYYNPFTSRPPVFRIHIN